MLDDVLIVLQRAEMTTRMAEEIERNCVELGGEGRLIRMQLDELMEDVLREKAAVVFDYERSGDAATSRASSSKCSSRIPASWSSKSWPRPFAPGARRTRWTTLSRHVATRVLSRIPRLPDSIIRTSCATFAPSTP